MAIDQLPVVVPRAARPTSAPKIQVLAGALGTAILCTAFTALYWNRFLSPSAGATFFYLGEQILKGHLPYRDLFLVVTPLSALKIAALIHLFGDTLLVVRLEALIERTLLGLMLYFLLARLFRSASSMLASFLTIVLLASDPADSLATYHIDSVFWAAAATLCVCLSLDRPSRRHEAGLVFFAGIACGLSLLTKQTTGVGITAALAITGCASVWRLHSARAALRFLAALVMGWLLPLGLFLAWLNSAGALRPFLSTIFTTSTSKGSLGAVLGRPLLQAPGLFIGIGILAALLLWRFAKIPRSQTTQSLITVAVLAISGTVTLALAAASVYSGGHFTVATALRFFIENSVIMLTLTGSALVFLVLALRFFQEAPTARQLQIWVISAASFSVAYMLSLSWAVYSPMVAPGLALISALALDRMEGRGAKPFVVFASLVFALIYVSAGGKLTQPFSWMYWSEPPVSEARRTSTLPKLAGLQISDPTLTLTEDITRLVKDHTKPGDSLLVYPYFPIFHVLTDLDPPTYAFNHYLDVCPDPICREDAAQLTLHPPDAIVYLVESDEDLTRDEAVFRSGRQSGSRAVVRTIEQLVPGYHKLLTASIPGSSRTIEVYSRR